MQYTADTYLEMEIELVYENELMVNDFKFACLFSAHSRKIKEGGVVIA